MKLDEAIKLLEVDRLRDTRLRIKSWQDQRVEATRRLGEIIRGEVIATERAKVLEKNPELDELEVQKLAVKNSKSNVKIVKNLMATIAGEVSRRIRR